MNELQKMTSKCKGHVCKDTDMPSDSQQLLGVREENKLRANHSLDSDSCYLFLFLLIPSTWCEEVAVSSLYAKLS